MHRAPILYPSAVSSFQPPSFSPHYTPYLTYLSYLSDVATSLIVVHLV